MRFGILGPLEVRDGHGRPVALRHPAERRLLLRLLLAGGEPVPVERLAADLPDDGRAGRAAVSGLFDRVGSLRRRLEPGRSVGTAPRVLLTTADGYALAPEPLDRDDAEAAELLLAARRHLAAGRDGAAGERAAQALDLWRGPALIDAGDAPWARADRRRLAVLEADTRLVLAAAAVLDHPAHAGSAIEAARAAGPPDGRLWALEVAVELALERDVAALRAVRRARLALEADGLDRGPALLAMEAAVLRVDHGRARALCRRMGLGDPDLVSPTAAGDAAGPGTGSEPEVVARPVTGGAVGRAIQGLPGRTHRLVELLAATVEWGGDGAGAAGLDLLARAAGLTPPAAVEHLGPAVALGLVVITAEPAAVRFCDPAMAAAVLGGLTPFRLRRTRHLIDQATRAACPGPR